MKGPRKRNIKSRIIRVRISETLYQSLIDHAEKTRRSISEIIRRAIREYLHPFNSTLVLLERSLHLTVSMTRPQARFIWALISGNIKTTALQLSVKNAAIYYILCMCIGFRWKRNTQALQATLKVCGTVGRVSERFMRMSQESAITLWKT